MKHSVDKVKAVKDSRRPETKEALRIFLGMTGYLSNFIPRYASITALLRKLMQKDVRFHWRVEEQDTFEKLKASITIDDTMIFFKPINLLLSEPKSSTMMGYLPGSSKT